MIDLHCHSIYSDGEFEPNILLQKAEDLNLSCFAITDHNNCFAYNHLDKKIFSGKLITGVEIATSFNRHIIEILGYGMDIAAINDWHKKEVEKEPEYAELIYNRLVNIFEENNIRYSNFHPIIGKDDPTGKIKQYVYNDLLQFEENTEIIGKEILCSYSNFNKIGLNNPSSILFINEFSRFLTLEDAVNLIHKNDGLCFLAHVYQYNVENHIDFLNDVLRCVKLDGLEVYHSSFSESQIIEISSYADAHNLYKSGGSDFHGKLKPGYNLGLNMNITDELIEPWISSIISF